MIKVKRWRPVALWQWSSIENSKDLNRECGICQAGLEAVCTDCQVPGEECPVVKGRCSHPFHSHCIVKWTASQMEAAAANEFATEPMEPHCPMCRQKWELCCE